MRTLSTTEDLPAEPAQFFKALADETRLEIIRILAQTDLRVGELVNRLNHPQNAVSYHLKQLRELGLLRGRHSSLDARDVYYSVDLERLNTLYMQAANFLHPALPEMLSAGPAKLPEGRPQRILYLCTHNSARSLLAEAITRHLGSDQITVASAGSEPSTVHPLTRELLSESGIDASNLRSKHVSEWIHQPADYVITVCDRMREECPPPPEGAVVLHWSLPDPVAIEAIHARRAAFHQVRDELTTRIRYLLARFPTGTRLPSSAGTGGK